MRKFSVLFTTKQITSKIYYDTVSNKENQRLEQHFKTIIAKLLPLISKHVFVWRI